MQLEQLTIPSNRTARPEILQILGLAQAIYFDRVNNYLSIEIMAEQCGVSVELLKQILALSAFANKPESFNFPNDL